MAAVTVKRAPVFKEGDLVATPARRVARVTGIGLHGERELRYLDLEGGDVALRTAYLTLISAAPVRPWKVRVLR